MEVERLGGRTEEPISSSYKMKRQVKLSLKRASGQFLSGGMETKNEADLEGSKVL